MRAKKEWGLAFLTQLFSFSRLSESLEQTRKPEMQVLHINLVVFKHLLFLRAY